MREIADDHVRFPGRKSPSSIVGSRPFGFSL
jgi:hypothetical protein